MRKVVALLGVGVVLGACGADGASASSSAISRTFDDLASSITDCAATLGECNGGKPAQPSGRCSEQFLGCRASAGKPAEQDLAAAVSDCRELRDECSADDAFACDRELHECIGDASPRTIAQQQRYRSTPDAKAPTYQCFGMLRECVASSPAPSECAAQARTCVIAAVGDLPAPPKPQ